MSELNNNQKVLRVEIALQRFNSIVNLENNDFAAEALYHLNKTTSFNQKAKFYDVFKEVIEGEHDD